MIKFAHLSDVHLGSWNNHPDLREYPLRAWEKAVDKCIEEGVDFIIIAGDFFDTSLPSVDALRKAASEMRRCKENGIGVYAIAGSHDFSPTGKSMLNVLEDAGLLKDVAKMEESDGKIKLSFTVDKKTGAKICGIVGRRGALERSYFENLDRSIEKEDGKKIFVFHSGISEHAPKYLDTVTIPLSLLPKNFDYYASGHVHVSSYDEKTSIAFPGPLFPADFHELERYDSGFYIVELNGALKVRRIPIKLCDVSVIKISVDGKKISDIEKELLEIIEGEQLKEKILLLKIEGVLEGRIADINLKPSITLAVEKGAAVVKKSMRITSKEYQETKIAEHKSVEDLEEKIIKETVSNAKLSWLTKEQTERLVFDLMSALKEEKNEDETVSAYQERIKQQAAKILGV